MCLKVINDIMKLYNKYVIIFTLRGRMRYRLQRRAKQRENRLNNNLLILGAGGYGHVVREIAEDSGIFDKIDFLDDSSPLAIGKFGDAEKFLKGYPNAVVALGNAELRLGYIEKLRAAGFQIPAIISPKAYVSKSAKIGNGTIVEPFSAVNANSEVGIGVLLRCGSVIDHNAKVGDFCYIDCGVVVKANNTVGFKIKIAANSVVEK